MFFRTYHLVVVEMVFRTFRFASALTVFFRPWWSRTVFIIPLCIRGHAESVLSSSILCHLEICLQFLIANTRIRQSAAFAQPTVWSWPNSSCKALTIRFTTFKGADTKIPGTRNAYLTTDFLSSRVLIICGLAPDAPKRE